MATAARLYAAMRSCRATRRLLLPQLEQPHSTVSLRSIHRNASTASAFEKPQNDTDQVYPYGHPMEADNIRPSMVPLRIAGFRRHVDPLVLRDSCKCSLCIDPQTHQKTFNTADIPPTLQVRKTTEEPGFVSFYWSSDVAGFPEEHHTRLPEQFLSKLGPDRASGPPTMPHVPWPPYFRPAQFFDYESFIQKGNIFRSAITELGRYGVLILRGVPESEKSVETIGECIGPLRNTFYGLTWDVKDKPGAVNVADTSGFLGLHMDLLYMKQPPGFQILHCINSSPTGGESIFADGTKAAQFLEKNEPDLFEVLKTFPVKYHYVHPGKTYEDVKPTIDVPFVAQQDIPPRTSSMFANINYSPLFQGRLVGEALNTTESLRSYHRAIRAFVQLLERPSFQYRYLMQPGDCVIFNNRRILHGRTQFTQSAADSGKPRWLKGAYLDTDDFLSTYETIQRGNEQQL